MKLISMTDFVLEQAKIGMEVQSISHQNLNRVNRFEKIVRYANFLKQPLKLEMFVPCDEEGNLLEEDLFKNNKNVSTLKPFERISLEKAKEKVLFEGFKKAKNGNFDFKRGYSLFKISYYKNIEHFLNDVTDITLTPNSIKQLGL